MSNNDRLIEIDSELLNELNTLTKQLGDIKLNSDNHDVVHKLYNLKPLINKLIIK